MEIRDRRDKGYIEVWLTSDEQRYYDRKILTQQILSRFNVPKVKKVKVAFFLSGTGDLFQCAEGILLNNLRGRR